MANWIISISCIGALFVALSTSNFAAAAGYIVAILYIFKDMSGEYF